MKQDLTKLKRFYKGIVVHKIYKRCEDLGMIYTRKEIDIDIKKNADFPYESITDPRCTIEDMQNLIVWGFMLGDCYELNLNYPADELDNLINLNIR